MASPGRQYDLRPGGIAGITAVIWRFEPAARRFRHMDRATTVALAESLARGIELAGMAVMVLGGIAAVGAFLARVVKRRGTPTGRFETTYRELRADLGRAILLGLEFLVAADIIGTVAVEPSFRNLGVLALIVAIRTFLSFSLELEISGRWPWQHARARGAAGQAASDASGCNGAS